MGTGGATALWSPVVGNLALGLLLISLLLWRRVRNGLVALVACCWLVGCRGGNQFNVVVGIRRQPHTGERRYLFGYSGTDDVLRHVGLWSVG
jgi:hypothetical protein